ncbi:PadR family transcriptional regulator [Dictyobacter aurantiacus]|uniref:PadR family transcriptional regulator n=1 Tax=Dictyobacter aurantiacus TaxID=1936993 RepID=A0A401ZNP9_9CHLR|nr:PadR family transcriptional regulator [Dictyobacter aurantiacus]GCE08485.1 hypothetical protein KDAU_58140 [Dictyobacter aurantiacus]
MSKANKSKYALLGMLSLSPMSGYTIKKTISRSLGHFWHESYPQIYPTLKQLEAEGLTTSTMDKQEGRPDSLVYSLTERGWEELQRWLERPFEYQVERHELLLKLFFAGIAPASLSIEHVRRHRAVQAQALQTYGQIEAELKTMQPQHANLPYWLMTLSYGKHIMRAQLAWCDETLAALEHIAAEEAKK